MRRTELGVPELAVVIPTVGRPDLLARTLSRIEPPTSGQAEVIVVDDGSEPRTQETVARLAAESLLRITYCGDGFRSAAVNRNLGMNATRAPICLFIGDDTLPTSGLIDRHLTYHRAHPQPTAAMLGLARPAPPFDRSPFMRWTHEQGVQFSYGLLKPGAPVPPEHLWTANVSLKREFVLAAGGFDESFEAAGGEDSELGIRLARRGLELIYDPDAVVEHYHPTDLGRTLERMNQVGRTFHILHELAPELEAPTRPALRHRLKAAALTSLMRCGVRTRRIRETSWQFLCDEVLREAYWDVGDESGRPIFGAALARFAQGEAIANPRGSPDCRQALRTSTPDR